MNNFRRLVTLVAGLALSAPALAATAPAAFAIIPGPARPTTVAVKYAPPVPVAAGPPAARQALSNVGGHSVATGSASIRVTQGPGRARPHRSPGRQPRHNARRQPDPAPVPPAAGHTGIMPA